MTRIGQNLVNKITPRDFDWNWGLSGIAFCIDLSTWIDGIGCWDLLYISGAGPANF
jgi:hypothetical protein